MTTASKYEEDIECVVTEKNGRGGIFLGNVEAAQNLATLKSNIWLTGRVQN